MHVRSERVRQLCIGQVDVFGKSLERVVLAAYICNDVIGVVTRDCCGSVALCEQSLFPLLDSKTATRRAG